MATMYFIRKLKSQQLGIELIALLFFLLAIIIVFLTWGPRAGWGIIAIVEFFVVIMHMNMYFKTKNTSFLWLSFAFIIIVIFAVQISIFGMTKTDPEYIPSVIAAIAAFLIIAIIIVNKKSKWRTREMLELAAMPVDQTGNGFTERPFSCGIIDATTNEIESFARFISKNMIAMTYRENDKIIFSFPSSWLKQNGLKRGYKGDSWISVSTRGDVSVFISRKDYLCYQDTFSFDQLCTNLALLFTGFFELYKKGEGIRIMDKLNALRLNPITE
jgi:hypothetical protein